MKVLNLHTALFQPQKIAPKLTKELLALEQKGYDCNGTGTKLEKIGIFCTDMPFSLPFETLNQANFVEILTFFYNIEFITEEQRSMILEESNSLSFFKRYIKKMDVSRIESTFLEAAFGSQAFSEFDYAHKTGERAQDYRNNYGDLPIYEVADITRRNYLIRKIVQTCLKKLNMYAGQTLWKGFLTETLSDASNSPLVIHFWMSEKAIMGIKAYCAV
jgi:hypothetical protein